jgi:hypothetical protein
VITIHSNSGWINAFVPRRFKIREVGELTDTSHGTIAARCFWGRPETAMSEVHSLSQRYRDVMIYLCEPWERRDSSAFLPTVLREAPANVMIFADVLMDNTYTNYRPTANWFMVHDSLYQDTAWGRDLLNKLQHDCMHKQYRFDALLGVQRATKEAVYQHYLRSRWRDHIMLTYHKSDARNGVWDVPFFATTVDWDRDQPLDESCLTHTLWTDMPAAEASYHRVGTQNIVPVSIYNSCWYSIIAEGFMDDRGTRLTEKTAKALLSQRLFVYFGAVHDLRRMCTLGFRSFGTVIDETYDSIEDDQQRWAAAWQQVEYLCAQDPVRIQAATQDIREHNHRVFLSTDWLGPLTSHMRSLVDKYH